MTINRNSASLVNYDVILTGSGMRGSLRRCCLRWMALLLALGEQWA